MATEEDAELKDLVIQTLENSGILAQIRAKLRASVFLALENVNDEQLKKTANEEFQQYLSTDNGKLIVSLIYNFLKHFNLDSTLSVFESESQFGTVVTADHLTSLIDGLGMSRDELKNESALNWLIKDYQQLQMKSRKLDSLSTSLPLQAANNLNDENSKSFCRASSVDNDTEHSSHDTLTNKSIVENKTNSFSEEKPTESNRSEHGKHQKLTIQESKPDGAKSTFSLSSLNDAPPLAGIKNRLPQLGSDKLKQKHSQSSVKHSGESIDYEDDFHSSISINSPMKSDNNSIEEEIEENISGNIDEALSFEGTFDVSNDVSSFNINKSVPRKQKDEPVTSDRTISRISNTGIDYLESVG